MPTMHELRCFLEKEKSENYKLKNRQFGQNAHHKPNIYESIFHNMEIIDLTKGHRVKFVNAKLHECYRELFFKLSDNISAGVFEKRLDHIKEKILVPNLDILYRDGYMIFKIREDNMPSVVFEIKNEPHNLLPLGVDEDNNRLYMDLEKDPRAIVAGVPGCGKSTLLNTIIAHIMKNNIGNLYLIDLKAGIEFGMYEDCKQVVKYCEEVELAHNVIESFKKEMDRRFELLKEAKVKKYSDYIKIPGKYIPRYFLIIDEFADMMPNKKVKDGDYDVIDELVKIGRKARATGGHLIIATQRPNRDSLPPNLKAVSSCIIGFRATSIVNSKIVIDEGGLEDLEDRQFLCITQGRRIFGRTMFLKDEYLEKIVGENIVVKQKVKPQKHIVPDWL